MHRDLPLYLFLGRHHVRWRGGLLFVVLLFGLEASFASSSRAIVTPQLVLVFTLPLLLIIRCRQLARATDTPIKIVLYRLDILNSHIFTCTRFPDLLLL